MSRKRSSIKGLYAITPDSADTEDLLRRVRKTLAGGASVLQYRNKTASAATQLIQATALRDLAHEFSATFIVNDDPFLAADVNADGVHIGTGDKKLSEAREVLGMHKLIGVSCYNHLSLAIQAVNAGADYVAFGAFYASGTKPNAVRADVELLREGRALPVPQVAIGGITVENGRALVEAGANALAVISALFDAEDIATRAREFSQLFTH
jgi:thiamine-phosphate pyrophosphorylase